MTVHPFVLAIGDSLTAGYGLAAHEAFPARLQARLRARWPQATVQNAGVSGDTTADALRRLPRLLAGLKARPDLAIVEIGANDLLRGIGPAAARANLDAIVTELQRCGIPVLLATLDLPPLLAALAGGHATIYADVATRHGIPATPFFPAGVLGHPALVLADRLHPNARAIEMAAEAVEPAAVRMLEHVAAA